MKILKNASLKKWKFEKKQKMEQWKSVKMDIGKKGNWTLGKMVSGENGYRGKWKFARIEIWKNRFSDNANLEKCKLGKMQISIMPIW